MKKLLIILICFTAPLCALDFAMDATMGTVNSTKTKSQSNIDFSGHLWHQWDQMVLLGIGGGVQQFGKQKHYPATLSAMLRLPIGGQMLPVVTGDWGYAFGQGNEYLYKAGGGFDLKLGDSSSILGLLGYQNNSKSGAYLYARAGILLEF